MTLVGGLTLAYNASDFIDGKTVTNFAALPPAADNDGLLAICVNSQGVWLINYKAAGLYYSDGAEWIYQGDYQLTDEASEIGFTPAGGVTSTNVQAAIVEVAGMSGGVAWGDITGTLSAQTDLNSALAAKAPLASPTFTGTVAGITAAMVGAPSGSGTSSGTNTGDQTSIVGITGTQAQFDTACSDGNFLYTDDIGVSVQAYSAVLAGTTASFTTADETKLDYISVTQAVNLDTIESDTATNNAKVTNATHTGDATGSGALTVVALQGKAFPTLSAADDQKYPKYVSASNAFVMTAIAGGGDVVGPASATDNAIARYDLTTGKLLQNSSVTISDNGEILCAAGGTADAPLKFQAGTNLTTAEAGAIEFDGTAFYATAIASARQVLTPTMFAIVPSGGFALSTAAGVQSCFPAATDVWTLAASTTYIMEGRYYISKSTNSVTTALAFALGGGASITSIAYDVISNAGALNATVTSNNSTYVTQVASTVVTIATALNTTIRFRGLIRMNAGGTVTPQINFSGTAAGSPTMAANSYIMFTPIGSNTVASVGNVA